MKLTEEKVQELKSTHGPELICIETSDGQQMVFRKPRRLEFNQWYDNQVKGTAAAESLARQCLVFPGDQEFMAVLEKFPGVLMCKNGIADNLTDMVGADGSASAKKL